MNNKLALIYILAINDSSVGCYLLIIVVSITHRLTAAKVESQTYFNNIAVSSTILVPKSYLVFYFILCSTWCSFDLSLSAVWCNVIIC